eukprot:65866-Pyramimonas_sp.AAC.1
MPDVRSVPMRACPNHANGYGTVVRVSGLASALASALVFSRRPPAPSIVSLGAALRALPLPQLFSPTRRRKPTAPAFEALARATGLGEKEKRKTRLSDTI